jgi:hypothetical protein
VVSSSSMMSWTLRIDVTRLSAISSTFSSSNVNRPSYSLKVFTLSEMIFVNSPWASFYSVWGVRLRWPNAAPIFVKMS